MADLNTEYQTNYDAMKDALKSSPSKNLFTEPPSPASVESPPLYPFNRITQTESGHSMEMDDTPKRERIRIQHGISKNFIEMHPTGDQVCKIFGDGFEIVIGNKNVLVEGVCNIVINGDCNMKVGGDLNQEIDGDWNVAVKGKTNMRSVGDIKFSGDADVSIAANENFGGSISLSAADSVNIVSDAYVYGSITCDTLTASSRVDAGMGVSAGPYGFTSGLGGLTLGLPTSATPIAVPGSITTVGPITSMVSVNAPIGNFPIGNIGLANIGISSAVLMTDTINTNVYDFHWHPTPKGPSGLPDLEMM